MSRWKCFHCGAINPTSGAVGGEGCDAHQGEGSDDHSQEDQAFPQDQNGEIILGAHNVPVITSMETLLDIDQREENENTWDVIEGDCGGGGLLVTSL